MQHGGKVASRILALAAATVLAQAGLSSADILPRFQHVTSVSLSSEFFGDSTAAHPNSAFGQNPASIAFDGANAYVGGVYNTGDATSTGSVGIIKINNLLSLAPQVIELPGTQVTVPVTRGYDSLTTATGITGVFADSDAGGTPPAGTFGFIRRYDSDGNTVWTKQHNDILAGFRVTGLAIDPQANAGAPALASTALNSGRRAAYNLSTGDVIYAPSGGVGSAGLGEIFNPNPNSVNGVSLTTTYRDLAFDSAGNIAVTAAGGTVYANRTGVNSFTNLAGQTSATTPIATKQTSTGAAVNIGQGLAFVEGLSGGELLATSERVSTPFALSLSSAAPSLPPTLNGLDSRHIHILTTSGEFPTTIANPTLTGDENGLSNAYTQDIKDIVSARDDQGNPILVVLSFVENRIDVYTTAPEWKDPGSGNWGDLVRWTTKVPNGVDIARFGAAITVPSTVTLESSRSVVGVQFDNANKYTVAGPGTLTIDAAGNNVLPGVIEVDSGSHAISANVVFNDAPKLIVNGAGTLTLSGDITSTGLAYTKTGTGTLEVKHLRAGALTVNAGTLKILPNGTNSGVSYITGLVLTPANTPTLDLTNNTLVFDYAPDATSPFADFVTAYLSGSGVISSSVTPTGPTALAIVEASSINAAGLGLPVATDATSVIVRYTNKGDTNLDKVVNFADLLTLAQNYGSTSATWVTGDTNYDGIVNFADLLSLAQNYGAPVTGSFAGDWALAQSEVPEPTTLALAGAAGLTLIRRRRGSRES